MARKKSRLGDVYAIPLPNDTFAFGRLYKESCLAIYRYIGTSISDLPKTEDYKFIVGVYQDILKSGEWIVVEQRPFPNDEEAWPPPMCVKDSITGKFSIYHKGEFKESNQEECESLETAAVWDKLHVIDRIMGDNKWNER